MQSRRQVEYFEELLIKYKNDKGFHTSLNNRKKIIEDRRRVQRQAAAKEREIKMQEDKKARSIARMKYKETVKANIYKRQTYRSP